MKIIKTSNYIKLAEKDHRLIGELISIMSDIAAIKFERPFPSLDGIGSVLEREGEADLSTIEEAIKEVAIILGFRKFKLNKLKPEQWNIFYEMYNYLNNIKRLAIISYQDLEDQWSQEPYEK